MVFKGIRRVTKEAFINIVRNRLTTMASITAIVSTLLILGIILCMVLNINQVMSNIESSLEITVFIEDGISDQSAEMHIKKIDSWDGVMQTNYTSASDALKEWRKELGEEGYILEGYDEANNPVPASVVVTLNAPDDAEKVIEQLNNQTFVKSIRYNQEFIDSITTLSWWVHIVGGALLGVLAIVALVVTTNAIRMSIYSRRYEINIMKYVGAANGYIRRPFIFEGILLGLLAAIIAYGIVMGGYNVLLDKIQFVNRQDNILGSMQLLALEVVAPKVGVAFVALACGVSAISSFFTTHKHLNV